MPTRLFVGPVFFFLQLTDHSRVKAGQGIVKIKLTVVEDPGKTNALPEEDER
ncbi:hypothetical protein VT98_10965 [Candidatus Electrothrix communis]|uniref:Uncharacterized protein n=1 Tax=Candidatus Electrothrix communis TaxID=1859133 RepID=A0A3S4TES8_9BACT|nr:hypothetical protein [Desulfobulbus sp. US4]RWX48932.1 hypothetical protein VT98_10965 [Candidatus Electrothrix communis]